MNLAATVEEFGLLGLAVTGVSHLGSRAKTSPTLNMKTTIKKLKHMRMHNPPHPGEVLRKLCLEPLGLNVTEAAKALGVSRNTLASLLNGHKGISPEMAMRLSIAFDTTAESWMNQQVQYDLWEARLHSGKLQVTRLILKNA